MKHAELGRLKHWLSVLLPMLGLVTLPNLAVLDLELSAYFYDDTMQMFSCSCAWMGASL